MNQPLWGNKHIIHVVHKKKHVLFLRNWIRSGDLRFVNGLLDEDYLYDILIHKANIHYEIMMVRNALHLYQESLKLDNRAPVNVIKPIKARDIYCKFKCTREKE